jgi:gliding motility-associated-like protein
MIPGTVPLKINAISGEITVTPDRVGLFVFSVLVEEFRNGVRIGLQRRDFQLKVVDCVLNQKPQILARESFKTTFIGNQKTIDIEPKTNACINLFLTDQNPNQELNWKILSDAQNSKYLTLFASKGIIKSATDTLRSVICFDECIFGTAAKIVPVKLIAYDNGCPLPLTDTLQFNLRVAPTKSSTPSIFSTLPNNQLDIQISKKILFNIFGSDLDKSNLQVEAIGIGFDIKSTSIKFQSGNFSANFNLPFDWTPNCADYTKQKTYNILFKVSKTVCGIVLKDSLTVKINLAIPANIAPKIEIGNLNNPIEIIVDPNNPVKIELPVLLSDQDLDQNLVLLGQGNGFSFSSYGMNFASITGNSSLKSTFSWTPSCQNFEASQGKVLEVLFKGADQSCSPNAEVEITQKFVLKSPEDQIIKSLPNVITPNNDGKNDYFSLENIPLGTCSSIFKEVNIQNRWGTQMFKSEDKNFIWGSKEIPSGLYYYQIIYTNKTYKGHLTILN